MTQLLRVRRRTKPGHTRSCSEQIIRGLHEMLELHQLTQVGFGGYRLSGTGEHYAALARSLSLGCNLIDTSSNYANGKSEELIGEVIAGHAHHDVFVLTKAGYIQEEMLARLGGRQEIEQEIVWLGQGSGHCIHPDFLKTQIEQSCGRLQRARLDGLLLHNPEYYFRESDAGRSQVQYYQRIKRAFELLEDQVAQGKIGYYGVSSNTFPLSTALPSTINLNNLLNIARDVSGSHHFRLIQFPFNLLEREALKMHHDGVSLIETARRNNLRTFSNRPLNALRHGNAIRLATYEDESPAPESVEQMWKASVDIMSRQLERIGFAASLDEHEVIVLLNKHCGRFESVEAVEYIFHEHLYPLLFKCFGGPIPKDMASLLRRVFDGNYALARRAITDRANGLRSEFARARLIKAEDDRPLAVLACENYLQSGIDHVLVGMRRIEYVDQLAPFFRSSRAVSPPG
jgi:aryl-alcohol dehydrogenase-like predicted oxidoreductase